MVTSAGKPAPELLLLRLRRLRAAPLGRPRNPDAPPIAPRLLPSPVARSAPAGARPVCWRLLCDACASAVFPIVEFFFPDAPRKKAKMFVRKGREITVSTSSFPKTQECLYPYVFLRQEVTEKGIRKSQFAPPRLLATVSLATTRSTTQFSPRRSRVFSS